MNLPDEELQKKAEVNNPDVSEDGMAYKKVFTALPIEPDFRLPVNFADNVVQQIDAKEARTAAHEMYWLAAGLFLLLAGALVGALLIGFRPTFGGFRFFGSYPGLFAFGVLFLLFLHWVDKRLVRTPTL
ncbi:MAG: hypothetical protein LW721_15485 [Flammeovirgaceae bacterium]|jgi:hypothetical protein|nr:hypothetical protein [Flammeovirgaceae bacterium]